MKGILMKPEMVVAIAERRKTNTRRLGRLKEINQEPDRWLKAIPIPKNLLLYTPFKGLWQFSDAHDNIKLAKPRYQVGETVYIREACYKDNLGDWRYKLDDGLLAMTANYTNRNSINPLFLPEILARHFIEITDVRAERLQDLRQRGCYHDALLEGFTNYGNVQAAVEGFVRYWNSINKDYPWDSNPWVWVYTFRLKVGR